MSIKYAKPSQEGLRQKENKMIIEQNNGYINISDIIDNYLVSRKYMYYTKSQGERNEMDR